MAIKIPTANDAGLGREKQRAVNATQDINASPISGGDFTARQIGQAGQAFAGLGNVAIKRYQQQIKVADENAGMESYNGFAKELNENANMGDNAWFSRKGKNALGTYEESQKTMDKLAEKYSNNLQNDRQRNEFFRRVSTHRLSMDESISRYESNQRSAYNIETEKSFVQTNIQNASLNYTDPNQIKNAEDNIIQITKENREGLPEDALNLRVKSRLSLLRTEVISKLSSLAPYKAAAYLRQNKDSLTPEDLAKAQNYVERGAEENFYALLEKDPVKANEALDKGFYSGVVDNKKRVQFKNAIDTQVNNMANRARTKQFLSTLKNENQLFDSIVGSNREDAFKKLYEYGKGFNADPAFIEKTRDILLKSKGATIQDKDAAITNLETSFQSFKLKKKDGEYSIDGEAASLPNLVEFDRSVELARLRGEITDSMANSYRKRSTPALIEAAKREQGYDDIDLFDGSEDYDKGTQSIQEYAERNKIANNSPEKVRMMSRFIELYDQIPQNIKQDPRALDTETDNLVKFVIDEKAKVDSPTLRALGVPNAVVDDNGDIKNIKGGKTDTKPSVKIEENFTIRKGKDGNEYRVYKDGRVEVVPSIQKKSDASSGLGIVSDAFASDSPSQKDIDQLVSERGNGAFKNTKEYVQDIMKDQLKNNPGLYTKKELENPPFKIVERFYPQIRKQEAQRYMIEQSKSNPSIYTEEELKNPPKIIVDRILQSNSFFPREKNKKNN